MSAIGQEESTSIQDKHLDRVLWVKDNLIDVVSWLGLHQQAQWGVEGIIVTSRRLISSHLGHATMPVLSVFELKEALLT